MFICVRENRRLNIWKRIKSELFFCEFENTQQNLLCKRKRVSNNKRMISIQLNSFGKKNVYYDENIEPEMLRNYDGREKLRRIHGGRIRIIEMK